MKIKDLIRNFKLLRSTKWKITDFLMEVKNAIDNQSLSLIDYMSSTSFTCYRNREGFCLYVPSKEKEKFLSNKSIYSKEFNVINMSEIRRHKTKRNVTATVYNRITPSVVKMKFIEYISINDIEAYLVYSTDLTYNDELYTQLINYNKIEGKYMNGSDSV